MSTQPDLTAYLGRVGVRAAPPSEGALAELLGAHVRTFSFDNLDILLGQHPGVELAAVEEKFVGRGRGGYCFEHATLLGAVLTALGYDAVLHLGRVHDAGVAGRTHLVVVVALEGRRLLLDPGFGSSSLVPVPLEDGAVVDGGLHRHRVVRGVEGRAGDAWQLWAERSSGWELMHSTDELPVRPVDVAMGHLWTSTSPTSRWRTRLVLTLHRLDADGALVQTAISLDGMTERRRGAPARRRDLDLDELPTHLGAAGLTASETGRLLDRVRELRAAT